jgi:TolB-like protein/class 3 adenylate cyclase/predicted Zn-dependent protease
MAGRHGFVLDLSELAYASLANGREPTRVSKESEGVGQVEIGHILCTDIVGYSKLSIDQQKELLRQLNGLVRQTEQFRRAEAANKLIRLPTGDGMILVFLTSPLAPVECALEIAAALKTNERIPLRMGVHSGPVEQVRDVNDRSNVAGAGINMAQRVMDCGDAGHILVSKRVAEDLMHYDRWQPHLHDLGEVTVKHGVTVHVFNLWEDGLGNPQLPAKLEQQHREEIVAAGRARTQVRRKVAIILVPALIILCGLVGYFVIAPRLARNLVTVAAGVSDKSIAVLPFDSFSGDKENAYFTDGIQDEILTDLSKIADLKVISRTSVNQYRGVARNLKEIGKALGVAYILEGSVQKAGGRVRVNTQLIDTRTDAHVWAEKFDRELSDIFAIQTELAEKIVAQLRLNLTPREKVAIKEHTTADAEAYDLFLRSKKTGKTAIKDPQTKEEFLEAERLVEMAITRDPKFALAYCRLMQVELDIYWLHDHDPARKRKAEEAMKTAMRLRPDVGEVRLAQAAYYYQGDRDFEQARTALDIASRMLPNNSEIFLWSAAIDRKHGKWDEALVELQRAIEVDPHNPDVLFDLASTYEGMRQYSEADRIVERGLASFPESAIEFQLTKLNLAFDRGDTQTCRAILDSVPAGFNPNGMISYYRFVVAYLDRDWPEATRVVDSAKGLPPEGYVVPFAFLYGQIARGVRDTEKAQASFAEARKILEETAKKRPDSPAVVVYTALCDAALGRKEDAIRGGKTAVAQRPIAKDATNGVPVATNLAQIYAWAGEKDRAIEQLASVAMLPNGPTPGELQKNADWDDLRGDSRFESIVAKVVAASK